METHIHMHASYVCVSYDMIGQLPSPAGLLFGGIESAGHGHDQH